MTTPAAVPDRLVAQMLEFGRLLHSNTGARRRPGEELVKKVAAEEENLALAIETSKVDALRDVFGFNRNGKHTDSLTLRIVCLVAYAELAGTLAPEVRVVSQAVCLTDDLTEPLRARQTVFRLCVRGHFSVIDSYGKQQVRCGQPLLDLFRGSSQEPLFFNSQTVRQVRQEQEFAKKHKSGKESFGGVKTARQIYAELDQYIIGQHDLKVALSVAARHALLRREMRLMGETTNLPPKPNVLICGPSGTAKSMASLTLAKILGLPFAALDLSQVTASGYVGDDVSGLLYLLSESANAMGIRAEDGGVLFADEICKLASTHYSSPTTTGVQFELLKILDGGKVTFSTSGLNKWGGGGDSMDTSNLLVICAGAFSWLEDDLRGTKQMGFARRSGDAAPAPELRALLTTKGGLIPELTNRFSAVVRTSALSPLDIAKIVQSENGPLGEYRATLAAEKRTLIIEPDAALLIGSWSVQQGLMGRGPRAVLGQILQEPLFAGTPKEVRITRALVAEVLKEDNSA